MGGCKFLEIAPNANQKCLRYVRVANQHYFMRSYTSDQFRNYRKNLSVAIVIKSDMILCLIYNTNHATKTKIDNFFWTIKYGMLNLDKDCAHRKMHSIGKPITCHYLTQMNVYFTVRLQCFGARAHMHTLTKTQHKATNVLYERATTTPHYLLWRQSDLIDALKLCREWKIKTVNETRTAQAARQFWDGKATVLSSLLF